MRTNALAFLTALIVLVLAPAILADHHNGHPGDVNHPAQAGAPTHAQPADADHHDHGHPHQHTFLQWLHNALFGHFHHDDAAAVPADSSPIHDHQKGKAGVHVLPGATHGNHGADGHGDISHEHVAHPDDCTGIR